MKAAVYHGPRDIRYQEVPTPEVGENQILCRVRASGICGSDLHMYRLGIFEELGREIEGMYGLLMGHEWAGEVVELGAGVTGIKVGDRLAALGRGAYAEYVLVDVEEKNVHPIAPHVTFQEAATFEPLATSIHGIDLAQPRDGETIVILGAGIIGLGALQVLKATTSTRVIVVDGSTPRLEMARAQGADAVVDFRQGDPVEAVLGIVGEQPRPRLGFRGGNVDVVMDCAGAPNSTQQGLEMLRLEDGRLVLVALFEHPGPLDRNQVVRKQIRMQGSWTSTVDDLRRAVDMLSSGKIDRKVVVSHQFPLEQAAEAFAVQESGQAIKVILTP